MKDLPYKKKMSPRMKAISLIIVLLLVGFVFGRIVATVGSNRIIRGVEDQGFELNLKQKQNVRTVYRAATELLCMNMALLGGLLFIYLGTFRETKSSFILGLSVFIGILFLKSLGSLSWLYTAGLRLVATALAGPNSGTVGLVFLLTLCETFAMSLLLYLSME